MAVTDGTAVRRGRSAQPAPRAERPTPSPVVLHCRRPSPDATADAGALIEAGITLVSVRDQPSLLRRAARLRPDCTVVEAALLSARTIGALTDLRQGSCAPVLVVDCPNDSRLRAHWLNAGAEDCLSKPYCADELVARVMTIIRRERAGRISSAGRPVTCGDVTIDLDRRTVEIRGEAVLLTPTEFALLSYLFDHPDTFVTREQLLARVWGYAFGGHGTVTVHVRRLRKKIEVDPARPQLIQTVWGARLPFHGLNFASQCATV